MSQGKLEHQIEHCAAVMRFSFCHGKRKGYLEEDYKCPI